MTPEEMKKKTEEKIAQVHALVKELKLTVRAEEIVDSNMMIKKVVYFYDNEIYPTKNETENTTVPEPEA